MKSNKTIIVLTGMLVSNIFAFVVLLLTRLILMYSSSPGSILQGGKSILIFSDFVLIPIAMGVISIYFWRAISTQFSEIVLYILFNAGVAIFFSSFIMGEGYICLIIVSPLILAFMTVGFFLGKYLFKNNNSTLNASSSLLFLIIFIFDTFSQHEYENSVTDEIIIHAPKEVVWKFVAAHPVNTSPNDYWLFKVGLPYPIQSTVAGNFVGANRKCVFSNNAIFDETVVEYKKDSLFTFDVIEQPADPEIIGHIEIKRGQFILKDNVDGTTTLTGISWYKLNVYPAWYYNFWAKDITSNVHLRVMKHIKRLAEK